MIEPLWQWVLRDEQGAAVPGAASPAFSARFDAEVWLGERWRTLAQNGAHDAELRHAGTVVGRPVRLSTSD